jgi:hypothetical protein
MRPHPLVSNCDDDNDTLLFDQLQEYVLTHYPNPDRVGCLDAQTLEAFVYAPETLELSDCKFLHVFKCAECTRVLIYHRKALAVREANLESVTTGRRLEQQGINVRVLTTILLLLLCLVIG